MCKVVPCLKANPLANIDELAQVAETCVKRARFTIFAGDLQYLRTGGRVSNAAYLGATLLNVKPLIEIIEG